MELGLLVLASDALEMGLAMPGDIANARAGRPSLSPASPGKYFILKLLS